MPKTVGNSLGREIEIREQYRMKVVTETWQVRAIVCSSAPHVVGEIFQQC